MLKTLLKKQMAEIFRNYFYDPKKNKMRSKSATIAYIALYVLLMVGLLGGMFALFANWFYAIALGGLYFLCGRYLSAAAYLALAAAITAVVCALLLRWVKQRGTRIFAAL